MGNLSLNPMGIDMAGRPAKLAGTVSKSLKDKPWHVEGSENAEWVLIDYVDVVVHVFQKHIREFYDIEGLWGDAKTTIIETNY